MDKENHIDGDIVEFKTGRYFSRPLLFLGIVGVIVGIIGLFTNPIVGVFFLLFGAFFNFSVGGRQINCVSRQYRDYLSIFGSKVGSWEPLGDYPYIAAMRNMESQQTFMVPTTQSTSETNLYFEITLLSESHRQKFLLKRFDNKEKAKAELELFGSMLNLEVTEYSPATSRRRR